MNKQVNELRAFNYLTILKTRYEKVYRLLYPTSVRYFKVNSDGDFFLLNSNGSVVSGEQLQPLYEKIQAYERVFASSLEYESIDYFLRINEVQFLLEELDMNHPNLEHQLYDRLLPHVEQQIRRGFYQPLILPRILVNNEFVNNYLMTNIGHPDGSENYFSRMKIMIQQLSEYTQYIDIKNYFKIIQTLLIYCHEYHLTTNLIIKSYDNYCVLISGFETIDQHSHRLLVRGNIQENATTTVLVLDNTMIMRLISIYNDLE